MEKAYIIMAHKYPQQLHRLISRLNDGSSEFFVHIDKTVDISQFDSIKEFGKIVHFLDRVNSKWGGTGSVKAILNGFKAIRNSPKKFDRILLLSGQDYPIKSNEYINNFLKNSPYSNFVDHFPIPNYEKWPGQNRGGWYRVDKYYIGMKWYEFLVSKSMNLISTYIPFLRRKLPDNMKPYTGQTWINLDMYAVNYILDYNEKHPEYMKFHKYTFVADELYFHMILLNSKDEKLLKSIQNNDKRLAIWEKPNSPHPNYLRKSDFDTILKSDHWFARKFDANIDSEIFDLIDAKILNVKKPAHQTNNAVVADRVK